MVNVWFARTLAPFYHLTNAFVACGKRESRAIPCSPAYFEPLLSCDVFPPNGLDKPRVSTEPRVQHGAPCSARSPVFSTEPRVHHGATCSARSHVFSTEPPVQHGATCSARSHLFSTEPPVQHGDTCSARSHVFSTEPRVQHGATCSARGTIGVASCCRWRFYS
jgi:hypothetical protein